MLAVVGISWEIRDLGAADAAAGASLLGRGMCDNPNCVAAWRMGGDSRRRALTRFFGAVLGGMLTRGAVLGAFDGDDLVGVCGMAPPGRCRLRPEEKAGILPSLLGWRSPLAVLRAAGWAAEWGRRDPPEPHWHLGPLAVEPSLRGRGIGGFLLAEFCRRMDREGARAYLETDKEENVAFYERHGFRTDSRGLVLGLPNWYMTRVPR